MFCKRSRLLGAVTFVVLCVGSATTASAVSLRIDQFDRSDLAGARTALAAYQTGADGFAGAGQQVKHLRSETFEGHAAWNGVSGTTNPSGTDVGDFTTLGGHGTGGSAINGGLGLEVRNDNPFFWGRQHTSGDGGGNWLDSNDTSGMTWQVGGLPGFNSLAFLLTDVADVGARFSITIGDTLFSNILGADGRLANGSIQLVRILLPATVASLVVEFRNDRLNDGFGIDGATVAHIAPVPVPPAAALLLTGLLGFAGLRRRATRAA